MDFVICILHLYMHGDVSSDEVITYETVRPVENLIDYVRIFKRRLEKFIVYCNDMHMCIVT